MMWFVNTKIGRWLATAGALLLFVTAYLFKRDRDVTKRALHVEQAEQDKLFKEGKDASERERRDADGLSSSDIVDRVRRRDGDWRRM